MSLFRFWHACRTYAAFADAQRDAPIHAPSPRFSARSDDVVRRRCCRAMLMPRRASDEHTRTRVPPLKRRFVRSRASVDAVLPICPRCRQYYTYAPERADVHVRCQNAICAPTMAPQRQPRMNICSQPAVALPRRYAFTFDMFAASAPKARCALPVAALMLIARCQRVRALLITPPIC